VSATVLAARVRAVDARIRQACERAGRAPGGVTLVGVTKTHTAGVVRDAYRAGIRHFGENRVREGREKVDALGDACPGVTWHLIGHLQRNKAKAAAASFDILHGVDSEHIALSLSKAAPRRLRAFVEVNVAGEATKFGIAPADAGALVRSISDLPNIEVAGLMTVAPQVDDPEDVRWVFRRLRELRDSLGLAELSMGMTDDYEVAVEEGSTLVRVGRAIFGPRGPQGMR
jgi:hypothetical protein